MDELTQPGASNVNMKSTRSKKAIPAPDEMPAEYKLDWSKAGPNPYAARLRGRTVAVVLEPDVAEAFPTSASHLQKDSQAEGADAQGGLTTTT